MAEQKTEKIEREYTIPLRKQVNKVPRYKKANKAIRTIKEFLVRHMKVRDRDLNKIKIDKFLNEEVWFRGIKKPPQKIKVKVVKEGDIVRVELFDYKDKLKFKKAREDKLEAKAEEEAVKAKKAVAKPEEPTHDHAHEHGHSEEKTEEEKKEEKEKKAAVAEVGKKIGKELAKETKHYAGGKETQPKRPQRKTLAK